MTTQKLIKTIHGCECKIFGTAHHNRFRIGAAAPTVEVWERVTDVPTIGNQSARYKETFFSIVLCPDPEMEAAVTAETIKGMTSFDLLMYLEREEGVFVPFEIYDVSSAELTDDEWRFRVEDHETLKRLLNL